MLVVSDASPVNILIRIGQIDVLPKLFNSVVVPASVAEEMSRSSTPRIVRDWVAAPPSWFTVRTPSSALKVSELRHRGERDAISLAQEVRADAILLDEEKARVQALLFGVAVIGTVGVLQRPADSGLISDLKIIHDLLRNTNFRVSDKILNDSLARHLSYRKDQRK
jgi:predicted nucleic acid-binding protein